MKISRHFSKLVDCFKFNGIDSIVYAGRFSEPYSNNGAILGFQTPDSACDKKGESLLGDYDASDVSLVILLKRNCGDF